MKHGRSEQLRQIFVLTSCARHFRSKHERADLRATCVAESNAVGDQLFDGKQYANNHSVQNRNIYICSGQAIYVHIYVNREHVTRGGWKWGGMFDKRTPTNQRKHWI